MRPLGQHLLRALGLFAVFGVAGFIMGRSERIPETVRPSHLIWRTPAALLADYQGVVLAATLLEVLVELPLETMW